MRGLAGRLPGFHSALPGCQFQPRVGGSYSELISPGTGDAVPYTGYHFPGTIFCCPPIPDYPPAVLRAPAVNGILS